jgi:hypothetical protein
VKPRGRAIRSPGRRAQPGSTVRRNVSCTTSSATCRSEVSRMPPRRPRRRTGHRAPPARPASRRRPRERGRVVVARDVTVACHRLRPVPAAGFSAQPERPPLESAREDDVGLVVNTWRTPWTCRRTRSKSVVSRARIFSR